MKGHGRKRGHSRRGWGLILCAAGLCLAAGSGALPGTWAEVQSQLEAHQLDSRLLAAQLASMAEEDALDAWSQAVVDASPLLSAAASAAQPEETTPPAETLPPETVQPVETLPPETAPPTETLPPEEPLPTAQETTITTAVGDSAVSLADVSLTNAAGVDVDLEAVSALGIDLPLSGDGPQILIMHTHGSEAYLPDEEHFYEASDSYRTTDENFNMIRVGEEMKAEFEALGLSVVHDTTLYDYPSYTGSYSRALEGIEWYLSEYPTISVVLDVHRDALIGEDGTAYKVVTQVGGEKTAQVMMVIGTDAGGLYHPNWHSNLSFAVRIQQTLLSVEPTLPRPINLRSSRFNQQLTTGSLLVEVGSCGNTLPEAIRGARLFAQAAGQVLLSQFS